MSRRVFRWLSAGLLVGAAIAQPAASVEPSQIELALFGAPVAVPKTVEGHTTLGCEPLRGCRGCESTLAYSLCQLDTYYEEKRPDSNPTVTRQRSEAAPFNHPFTP